QACASLQYALTSLRPGQSQRSDLAPARSERSPHFAWPTRRRACQSCPSPPRNSSSEQSWHWPALAWPAPPHLRWLRISPFFSPPADGGEEGLKEKALFFKQSLTRREHQPCHTHDHHLSQLHRSLV